MPGIDTIVPITHPWSSPSLQDYRGTPGIFLSVLLDRVSPVALTGSELVIIEQVGLELIDSPCLCLPSAGIKSVCHHAQPPVLFS